MAFVGSAVGSFSKEEAMGEMERVEEECVGCEKLCILSLPVKSVERVTDSLRSFTPPTFSEVVAEVEEERDLDITDPAPPAAAAAGDEDDAAAIAATVAAEAAAADATAGSHMLTEMSSGNVFCNIRRGGGGASPNIASGSGVLDALEEEDDC